MENLGDSLFFFWDLNNRIHGVDTKLMLCTRLMISKVLGIDSRQTIISTTRLQGTLVPVVWCLFWEINLFKVKSKSWKMHGECSSSQSQHKMQKRGCLRQICWLAGGGGGEDCLSGYCTKIWPWAGKSTITSKPFETGVRQNKKKAQQIFSNYFKSVTWSLSTEWRLKYVKKH